MNYPTEYVAPTLTVDGVFFRIHDEALQVLLIERQNQPFVGELALPGGYNPVGETTREALKRIVQRKAGVDIDKLSYIEQLFTFDTIARDPRGHAVSVAYMGCARDIEIGSHATDKPQFVSVDTVGELPYEHSKIVQYAQDRLRSKFMYTNAAFAFLPREFTLTQLQDVYEIVLGKPLDKRNFRKKFLSLDLIEDTERMYREGAHRPAKLYEFKEKKLVALSRSFD